MHAVKCLGIFRRIGACEGVRVMVDPFPERSK